jgi:RNA polymerase sigma-70 factor, ECF subfamily
MAARRRLKTPLFAETALMIQECFQLSVRFRKARLVRASYQRSGLKLRPVNGNRMTSGSPQQLEAEIALLRRIAQGDREGFEEFYDRFANLLFSIAYRILKDQGSAEDVLQDSFLKIWEDAPLYDPIRGKPLVWAALITRNKAIDRLRATLRRQRVHDRAQNEPVQHNASDHRSSFEIIASGEAGRLVREAMQSLPDDQREAIELAFFESLTHFEIAHRLKQPVGTIKSRIRRGMIRLRDTVSADL